MTYEDYMKLTEAEKMEIALSQAAAVIATSDGVVRRKSLKNLSREEAGKTRPASIA